MKHILKILILGIVITGGAGCRTTRNVEADFKALHWEKITNRLNTTSLSRFLNQEHYTTHVTEGWLGGYSVNMNAGIFMFVGNNGLIDVCTHLPLAGWSKLASKANTKDEATQIAEDILRMMAIKPPLADPEMFKVYRVLFIPFVDDHMRSSCTAYFTEDGDFYGHTEANGPIGYGLPKIEAGDGDFIASDDPFAEADDRESKPPD